MILAVGKSEKVRKRIAWQFQEPTIKNLVRLIEPNNSGQIIAFTEEFANIQEKETIVRSNGSDFKKNLWLWVLNHLFDERGTLFNRVAFMESSIQQMARHHNMDYRVLFDKIQEAVQQISAIRQVDSNFILVLRLVGQNKLNSEKPKSVDSEKLMITHLNEYLNKDVVNVSDHITGDWNELVIHLAKNNSKELKQVFNQHIDNKQRLNDLVDRLDETGLEALLKTLFGSKSDELLASILLLSDWMQLPKGDLKKWFKKAASIRVNDRQQNLTVAQF